MQFLHHPKPTATRSVILTPLCRATLLSAAMFSMPFMASAGQTAQASGTSQAAVSTSTSTKSIFTGVVDGVNVSNVEGEKQVIVTLVSGSNRRITANLGELSTVQRKRLALDARMEIIGEASGNGEVVAERANVNGKALLGNGIGAKEIRKRVAANEKNFTGLISDVAKGTKETTFGLVSGAGTKIQTKVPRNDATDADVVKGNRASVTGSATTGNQIDADRVVVSGGSTVVADGQVTTSPMTAQTAKANYSGVLEAVETVVIDDVENVVVVIKSGTGRTVKANIGKLSDAKMSRLKPGSRMDIIGQADGSGIVDAERANLNGQALMTVN